MSNLKDLHGFKKEGVGRLAENLAEIMLEENLDNIYANVDSKEGDNILKENVFGIVLIRDSKLWDILVREINRYSDAKPNTFNTSNGAEIQNP